MGNTAKHTETKKSPSLFDKIEQNFRMDGWFESGVPTKYFTHVLFLTALGLIYIGNTHYADKLSRREQQLKKEVNDLRHDYTTLKADYMYEAKQSEVAKKVNHLGIKEGGKAPYKVFVPKNQNGN